MALSDKTKVRLVKYGIPALLVAAFGVLSYLLITMPEDQRLTYADMIFEQQEEKAQPCPPCEPRDCQNYEDELDFCQRQLEMLDRECGYCVSECMVAEDDEENERTVIRCK